MEERGRTSMVYYFHKDSEEESYFRTQLEEHGAAMQYRDPVALFSPYHHAQFPGYMVTDCMQSSMNLSLAEQPLT